MPKGQRLGGRQKGSLNKKTLSLVERFGDRMEDVVERLMIIAETSSDEQIAVKAGNALMPYFYPKLSSVQIKQDPDQTISAIKVEVVKRTTE